MDTAEILYIASVWVLPVLLAITFHEAAHGWVAWRLGDPTAKQLGRVTFNPFRHIDPLGTVIVPGALVLMLVLTGSGFLFGWAKPVPVDFRRLGNPRRDMILVAAAGPGMNFLLAFVALLLAALLPEGAATWATENLENAAIINLVLAVFNMLPVPPLDGGRVAVGLLPRDLAFPLARLEPFGLFIIIGLFFFAPALLGLDIFRWLVFAPVEFLFNVMAMLTGYG